MRPTPGPCAESGAREGRCRRGALGWGLPLRGHRPGSRELKTSDGVAAGVPRSRRTENRRRGETPEATSERARHGGSDQSGPAAAPCARPVGSGACPSGGRGGGPAAAAAAARRARSSGRAATVGESSRARASGGARGRGRGHGSGSARGRAAPEGRVGRPGRRRSVGLRGFLGAGGPETESRSGAGAGKFANALGRPATGPPRAVAAQPSAAAPSPVPPALPSSAPRSRPPVSRPVEGASACPRPSSAPLPRAAGSAGRCVSTLLGGRGRGRTGLLRRDPECTQLPEG